jgi:WhiB family redox-sensing transcriptional regulator
MIDYAMDWRKAGACLAADPDLFFPVAVGVTAGQESSRALSMCDGCPVKRQCLDYAIQTGEANGIWGGTTPEERIRVVGRNRRRPGGRTTRRESPGALLA